MQKWWKKIKWNKIKATKYITTLKNWRTKSIKVYKDWHRLCKDNDIRLYSDEWKILYKKRSWCVENVFWNIKMNLKFERFNLRWFKKVQIEWNLISLAHNLQKLIKFKLV